MIPIYASSALNISVSRSQSTTVITLSPVINNCYMIPLCPSQWHAEERRGQGCGKGRVWWRSQASIAEVGIQLKKNIEWQLWEVSKWKSWPLHATGSKYYSHPALESYCSNKCYFCCCTYVSADLVSMFQILAVLSPDTDKSFLLSALKHIWGKPSV